MFDVYCESLSSIGFNSLGLAVSGGSDSMALLYLSAIWRQRTGNEIKAVSVDHGLRNDSSNDVVFVQGIAKANKISHFSLKSEIDIKNLQGNIQDNARKVRYDLLSEWAKKEGIKVILLGHTLDDQEENLLIRFFRGSGVDGLASIEEKQLKKKILWFRPLLGYRREYLRSFLKENSKKWIEDPSNDNDRFKRVKVRKLLPNLKELGLIKKRFAETAEHMRRASEVLRATAVNETKGMIKITEIGEVKLDVTKFLNNFEDTRLRILSGLISWFSGNFYKPRFSQLENLHKLISNKKEIPGVALGGAIFEKRGSFLKINREFSAIKTSKNIKSTKVLWDNRWHLTFNDIDNQSLKIVPLGSIDYQKKEVFDVDTYSKRTLGTIPALIKADKLVYTPFSKLVYDLEVKLLFEEEDLYKYF